MSGGSYDYLYAKVSDMAAGLMQEKSPLRRAFGEHLKFVATAMHDIEWVDSCDYGKGDEEAAIAKVLGSHQMDELRDLFRIEIAAAEERGRAMKGGSWREGYERGLEEGRAQALKEAIEAIPGNRPASVRNNPYTYADGWNECRAWVFKNLAALSHLSPTTEDDERTN